MERSKQKQIAEALLLAAGEPLTAERIADVVPALRRSEVADLVAELGRDYEAQGRAFEIWEVAGGYQIRTRQEYGAYVRQLSTERPLRLSRAALETLAVIAYKQPVTRAEVEHVRGVDAGPVLKSLLERKLLRIAGHREVPGRPILYGTTRRFLEVFGLGALGDLPTLREIDELMPPGSLPEAGQDTLIAEGELPPPPPGTDDAADSPESPELH